MNVWNIKLHLNHSNYCDNIVSFKDNEEWSQFCRDVNKGVVYMQSQPPSSPASDSCVLSVCVCVNCPDVTKLPVYSRGQKFWEWHKYYFSQILLPQFVWWQFAYTPEYWEEWSDELISKSLFAMQLNWIPKKYFHCISALPQRTSWHHVSDSLVNTGVSVEEDKAGDHSVMLIEIE